MIEQSIEHWVILKLQIEVNLWRRQTKWFKDVACNYLWLVQLLFVVPMESVSIFIIVYIRMYTRI